MDVILKHGAERMLDLIHLLVFVKDLIHLNVITKSVSQVSNFCKNSTNAEVSNQSSASNILKYFPVAIPNPAFTQEP